MQKAKFKSKENIVDSIRKMSKNDSVFVVTMTEGELNIETNNVGFGREVIKRLSLKYVEYLLKN